MNTYTHLIVTLAAARRSRPADRVAAAAAAAGSVLPDLPYLARGLRLITRRAGRRELAAALDYDGQPSWPPDLALHSLLPPAAALAAAAAMPPGRARQLLSAFAAGWAGHVVSDLPVHATDARPPLWPLSGRRWPSPLSNWDRSRHAIPVAAAEHLLAAVCLAGIVAGHSRGRRAGHDPPRPLAGRAARARLGDAAAIVRAFAAHPGQVGEIIPTSRRTAAAMLDMARTDWRQARLVVELGAGTGAFTEQILLRAGPGTRVLAFEIDPVLAARLQARFAADTRLEVTSDSAEDLARHLAGRSPDAVVSALPLTTLPGPVRDRILGAVALSLGAGTLLAIQYSTARQADLERLFAEVQRHWSPANVPPAFLYACRQPRAAAGHA